jgi:hypothetical protein
LASEQLGPAFDGVKTSQEVLTPFFCALISPSREVGDFDLRLANPEGRIKFAASTAMPVEALVLGRLSVAAANRPAFQTMPTPIATLARIVWIGESIVGCFF